MSLPFSVEEFLEVFAEYNRAVWPSQLFLRSAAIVTVCLAARRRHYSGKVILVILAILWLWMGAIYHLTFFTSINRAAYIFAAFFILQSVLLFLVCFQAPSLNFRIHSDMYGYVGCALLAYSLVVYPALGYVFGHTYPAAPTFGAPCPTTIFTFGMLLLAEERVPVRLLLIPLLWAIVGVTAAGSLGMFEDFGLIAAGVISTTLVVYRNGRKLRTVVGQLYESCRTASSNTISSEGRCDLLRSGLRRRLHPRDDSHAPHRPVFRRAPGRPISSNTCDLLNRKSRSDGFR